ncbi:MAG TPA: hypothetical protein VE690_24000 [Rhodopila sp.]|nr:hypothetical protein [Rhodopila sp.]
MKAIWPSAATLAVLACAATATSAQTCRNFEGTILLHLTQEGCTSPVGICTVGKVQSGDPSLADANWFFTSLGTSPSAGLPEKLQPASMLSYAGSVVVTTPRDGTFTTTNAGVYDTTAKAFSQLDRITSGTGKFTDTKDRLIFITATGGGDAGFKSYVRGELCQNSP